MGTAELIKTILGIGNTKSTYIKIVDYRKLNGLKSELKSINRATTTPDLTKMQFRRIISEIDNLIEHSVPATDFTKKLQYRVAVEVRKKIKRYM